MKFSATPLLAFLSLSSQVIAAPVAEPAPLSLSSVATDVTSLITNYLLVASSYINSDLITITTLIGAARGDITPQIEVKIKASLADLVKQFHTVEYNIGNATASAKTKLTDAQVLTLKAAITNMQTYVASVEKSLSSTFSSMSTGSKPSLLSEFQTVQAAIPALYNPLISYAKTVSTSGTSSQASILSSLGSLITATTTTLTGALKNLGISITL